MFCVSQGNVINGCMAGKRSRLRLWGHLYVKLGLKLVENVVWTSLVLFYKSRAPLLEKKTGERLKVLRMDRSKKGRMFVTLRRKGVVNNESIRKKQ